MEMIKLKKTLISFVGITDPVRGNYDGPLLHLLRHLEIEKVYLLGTMDLLEKKEVFIERAIDFIETIKNCKIKRKYIKLDIKNPAIFSDFNLTKIIDKIYEENPNVSFVYNMTSATTQMVAALALDFVTNNRKGDTYQVFHYAPSEGKTVVPEEEDYDFENLYDNLEEAPNRLVRTNIESFKISKLKTELETTLKVRDYTKLMRIFEEYDIENNELKLLMEYAYNANRLSEFNEIQLKNLLKIYPNLLRFKKYKNKNYRHVNIILNYFLSWENELYKENYVSAMLKLKPLFYEIMKYMIIKFFKENDLGLDTKFYRSFVRGNKIKKDDISDFNEELEERLNSSYRKEIFFDTDHLIKILEYFNIDDYLEEIKIIRKEEFDVRNKLAHDIDNKIKNREVKDSAEKSHKNVKKIIKGVFKEHESSINYQFFSKIDKLILKKITELQTK
jgi:hypothetical protein